MQLVVTIVTLIKGYVILLQSSLIGTVLSNLLLMVGTGILLGGIDRSEQFFNGDAVSSLLNELVFSIAVLIIPMAFQASADGLQSTKSARITTLSRIASILLIVSYICYAIYSYKSHASLFTGPHTKAERRRHRVMNDKQNDIAQIGLRVASFVSGTNADTEETTPLTSFSLVALISGVTVDTALLGLCTTFVCDSIDDLSQSRFVGSTSFIGFILLPIVSCNPHAITLARRDQMPQSFAISISGSVQLLLLVLPSTVLVGWMIGDQDMSLAFDGFQVVCLFISFLGLKCVTAGGKSNWYHTSNHPIEILC